jgi:RNA polymerase sigma factor (sigma-70 family)
LKYADLTPELERDLVARYQSGDRDAGAKLLQAHEDIIWKLIGPHARRCGSPDDAAQDARLGFFEGLSRVDMSSGNRLTSYAGRYAWGIMMNRHVDNSTIRVNKNVVRGAHRLQRLGQDIPEEMAEALQLLATSSIDAVVADDYGLPVLMRDVLPSGESSPESWSATRDMEIRRWQLLDEALGMIPARDRDIVERTELADEPESLADVARAYGLSREAIRLARNKAIERLGAALRQAMREDDAILWGGEWKQPVRREMAEAA